MLFAGLSGDDIKTTGCEHYHSQSSSQCQGRAQTYKLHGYRALQGPQNDLENGEEKIFPNINHAGKSKEGKKLFLKNAL